MTNAYLKERVPVRYEIKEFRRREFPEFPLEAYREAIVNSIIHFDYFLGDTIAIEKLKSSIIINNKGELLFPESEFGRKSEARNRLLADLLARTHYMEKAGTGIKRQRDACKTNGNDIHYEFSDSFWVTIQSNVSINVVDDVVEKRLNKILFLIKENKEISATQIAKLLYISSRTAQRDLEKLKKQKAIQRIGPEKGGYWQIISRE